MFLLGLTPSSTFQFFSATSPTRLSSGPPRLNSEPPFFLNSILAGTFSTLLQSVPFSQLCHEGDPWFLASSEIGQPSNNLGNDSATRGGSFQFPAKFSHHLAAYGTPLGVLTFLSLCQQVGNLSSPALGASSSILLPISTIFLKAPISYRPRSRGAHKVISVIGPPRFQFFSLYYFPPQSKHPPPGLGVHAPVLLAQPESRKVYSHTCCRYSLRSNCKTVSEFRPFISS
ncbi:hypothetical protein N657DRAFT_692081 [Parathielavia appendiculata]|uniref:Uncharacterized protein n=1 Tax=Parathielavia appendiculata TaxID=2587402 RepID=A0AAN6TX94_9PEZI|nr:hypothetical protein N657DRAFT_692081 [Parathielavia appendiculata]